MSLINIAAVNVGASGPRIDRVTYSSDGRYQIDHGARVRISKDDTKGQDFARLIKSRVPWSYDLISVGAAGPVKDGKCSLTHLDCHIDETELAQTTQANAYLCNDMPPMLAGADIVRTSDPKSTFEINGGVGIGPIGGRIVVATGSGLGYGHSLSNGNIELIGPSEGGHDPFAQSSCKATTYIEELLLYYMQYKYNKAAQITQEMLLKGDGIQDILEFLVNLTNHKTDFKVTDTTPQIILELIKERDLPDELKHKLSQDEVDKTAVIYEAARIDKSIHCVVASAIWQRLLGLYVGHKLQTDMPTRGAFLGGTPINKAGHRLAENTIRVQPFTFYVGLRTREDERFSRLVARFPIYGQTNDDAFPIGLARLALSKHGMLEKNAPNADNIPIEVV